MSSISKLAVFSVLCLIWSSTWAMIKVGLENAPPITSAAVRFMIAAALVFSILAVRRLRFPRSARFIALSLYLGVFQFGVPYALVYWAEQRISSGLTSILYSTMPLTVAVLARIVLGDPLSPRKVIGIVIGTLGTVFIFSDALSLGARGALWGCIAALVGAFLSSLSSVVMKRYSQAYHPVSSLFLPMAAGAVLLAVAGGAMERGQVMVWNAATWGSILYLSVVGSVVAFALYYWLIKHMDVTVLSYQTFIIPILACLIGWIFLDETVTIRIVFGGGMIVAGIALATVNLPYRKRAASVGYRQGP